MFNQKTSDPSGWVICPSKSFPGKFYYFNVLNGEAVWSLNDFENKLPKKDFEIKRVSNRFHGYPEPESPPEDNFNLTSSIYASNIHESPQKQQKFDEPTAIRYSTESYNDSRTIWTPVHFTIHTNLPVPCPQNPTFDSKIVHSGGIPLYKRFKNFRDPTIVFGNNNTVVRTVKNRFETSTPKKQANFVRQEPDHMFDMSSFEISVPVNVNFKTTVQNEGAHYTSTGPKHITFGNHGPKGTNVDEYYPNNATFENHHPKSANFATSCFKTANFQNNGPKNADFGEYNNPKNTVFEANRSISANFASSAFKTASFQNVGSENADFEEYNNPTHSMFETNCSKSDKFTSRFNNPNIETDSLKIANIKTYCPQSGKSETYVAKNSINFENVFPNKIPLFNTVPKSTKFETYVPKTTNFDLCVNHGTYDNSVNYKTCNPKNKTNQTYVPKTTNFENYITEASNLKTNDSKIPTNNEAYIPKIANFENYMFKATNSVSYLPKTANIGTYVPIIDNLETYYAPKTASLETYVPKSVNFETTPKISKILEAHNDALDGQKSNTFLCKLNKKFVTKDCKPNVTLAGSNKVDERTPEETTNRLDKTDLRYLLLAKRRNSEDGNSGIETKKPKLDNAVSLLQDCHIGKKRVRFNLEEDNTRDCDSRHMSYFDSAEESLLSPVLEQPQAPAQPFIAHTKLKDVWYIVTDADILLDKFNFIEKLVQADVNCSLLVPYVVELEIKRLSITECRGLQRVINARDLIRKLPSKSYCTVESTTNFDDDLDITEGILNCCLRAISDGYDLVLITNNLKLYNEAKSITIPCYNTKEIKDGVEIKPAPDLMKLTIIIPNDTLHSDKFPVHVYKKHLFTDKQNDNVNINSLNYSSDVFENINNITSDLGNENPKITITNTKSTQNEYITKNIQNKSIFDAPENVDDSNNPLEYICFDNSELSAHEIYSHLQQELPFKNVNNIKKIFDPNHDYENIINVNSKNYKNQIEVTKTQKSPTKSVEDNLKNQNKSETERASVFKIPKNPVGESTNACTRSIASAATDMSVPNLNIDTYFKMLQVKNKDMYEKLALRMDEWICTYTQIMEDILNDVIQHLKYMKNQLQYTLTEALIVIKQCYKEDNSVRSIIEKLYNIIVNCSCNKGKIKQNTKPEEFMQILSGSIYLIQTLQNILPDYERLHDSEGYLNRLVDSISNQELDMDHELLITLSVPNDFEEKTNRTNFVKEKSFVVDYLKKHYTHWEMNCDAEHLASDSENQHNTQDVKVFRTLGKHLNMFKIDQNKSMYCSNGGNSETRVSKVIKLCDPFESQNINNTVNAAPNSMKQNDCNTDIAIENLKNTSEKQNVESYPTSGNTFSNTCEKARPKMIRNLKLIDKYEEKLKTLNLSTKSSESLYLNEFIEKSDGSNLLKLKDLQLDHNSNSLPDKSIKKPENNESKPVTTRNHQIESVLTGNKFNCTQNLSPNPIYFGSKPAKDYKNETPTIINSKNNKNNDNYSNIGLLEDSDDSGFENENTHAHSLVKIFLNELSTSFKVTNDFVNKFVKEIRKKALSDNRKQIISDKASKALENLSAIIPSLRSIISRESAEVSVLKNLLLKAGIEATSDKRVTRYRQIVAKSLEQAVILENALKIVASTALDPDVSLCDIRVNLRQYYNQYYLRCDIKFDCVY